MGKLVLRYRSLIAAWPVLIILLCLRRPLTQHDTATFGEAIEAVIRYDLRNFSAAALIVAAAQTIVSRLHLSCPVPMHALLLGNEQTLLWPLSIIFLYINAGFVILIHGSVSTAIQGCAAVWLWLATHLPRFTCPR